MSPTSQWRRMLSPIFKQLLLFLCIQNTHAVTLNLCCPHGHARTVTSVTIDQDSILRCNSPGSKQHVTCELSEESSDKQSDVIQLGNQTIPLSQATIHDNFDCPNNSPLFQLDEYYPQYTMDPDGTINASYPLENQTVFETISKDYYCIDTYESSVLFCVPEPEEVCPEMSYTMVIYPVCMTVSALFFLLTLLSYSMQGDQPITLIDKITVGYLVNNLVCYIALVISYLLKIFYEDYLHHHSLCVGIGYSVLYSFLSFMFWINSMAANIFFRFSASMPSSSDSSGFLRYFLYSQGCPLLISLIVYIIDKYGDCSLILPRMGHAHCFLGDIWSQQSHSSWTAFFTSSEFIYFHSILLIIEVSNVILFLLTIYHLVSHWRTTAQILDVEDRNNKLHFWIVLKLFMITGIPWIGEFFSHIILHAETRKGCDSFWIRLLLDICPLFAGVSVFLVLVCNAKMIRKLRRTAGRLAFRASLRSGGDSRSSNRKTTRTLIGAAEMEMVGVQ